MNSLTECLSPDEIDIVRRSLKATVEGSFFPDWEFQTLVGVERDLVRQVYEAWPQQTVDQDEFVLAVIGSMNNLLGYPHGNEAELSFYVPEGRAVIDRTLQRLTTFGS